MDPLRRQAFPAVILAPTLQSRLVASGGMDVGKGRGRGGGGVILDTRLAFPARTRDIRQVSGCKLTLTDGLKLAEDWHPAEPLLLPVMHLMKEKFVFM